MTKKKIISLPLELREKLLLIAELSAGSVLFNESVHLDDEEYGLIASQTGYKDSFTFWIPQKVGKRKRLRKITIHQTIKHWGSDYPQCFHGGQNSWELEIS